VYIEHCPLSDLRVFARVQVASQQLADIYYQLLLLILVAITGFEPRTL
jgi:hypothetical protein